MLTPNCSPPMLTPTLTLTLTLTLTPHLPRQHCRRCGAIKKGHVCRVTDDEYFRTDRQLACGPNRSLPSCPTPSLVHLVTTPSPPRRLELPPSPCLSHPSSDVCVCVCVPPAGVLRERRTIAPPSYLAKEADETSEELSSVTLTHTLT